MRVPIKTSSQTEMIDVTAQVQLKVAESKMENGICMVFVPHTNGRGDH